MPRNHEEKYMRRNIREQKEQLGKSMALSREITEGETRDATEAIMENQNQDSSEGSASQPAFYSALFQSDIPPRVKPKDVYLQTPLKNQTPMQSQTGMSTPLKRLTLAEGSATGAYLYR